MTHPATHTHAPARDKMMTLAREYPSECMRIVQEGFEKEDRLAA